MTTIDEHLTLGEIVNRRPGAARVLHSYGLDFCCGGTRTLGDATAELGLDPEPIIAALEGLGPAPADAWTTMGIAELVDHIESTHHDYLHAELGYLDSLASKVVSVHRDRHPELDDVSADVSALRADLEPHLTKEERVLFPLIRRIAAGEAPASGGPIPVETPIAAMMAEHEATGDLLARLRATTDDFAVPDDACASYRALYEGLERLDIDTHLHVHKENNLLFPAVVALATETAADR